MDALPLDFEIVPAAPERDDALQLSLESWEGPLDLLLTLARNQKVDLKQISILALVEQYLTFIAEARELKLEVAADYLVMAAWLAYLKSALLLPKDPLEDPSPDELALRLQLRLQRLAAMRDAAMAMTCHVIFEAWDADRPATLSPIVIDNVIRQRIGFHGLLMTDDLDMKALSGDVPSRAADAIAAGCDIALNCWARMDDMIGIANALDPISTVSLARLEGAMDRISGDSDGREFATLVDQRDALLATA